MTRAPHDNYMIYVPDSDALPRLAWRYDAVVRAMHELGPHARVLRITEGELCRDLTHNFVEPERDEYPDDEISQRRHRADLSRKFTFGTRSL